MTNGYYQTPNKMIPLNDREPGEIAPIALEQLERWKDVVKDWDTYTDGRCNRCHDCHQNIWFSKDPQGHEYKYTIDEILALKVAHVRQCHSKQGLNQILDDSDDNATSGSGSSYPNRPDN